MRVQFQGVNEVTFKSWANVILAFFFKCLIIKMGFFGFTSPSKYIQCKSLRLFFFCLILHFEVRVFDKEGVWGLGMYEILIDLKIINDIHSCELSSSECASKLQGRC